MRYFIHQKNFDVAQEWMNELSPPKKHHLSLMLGRPAIISAMDELLPFPGLWSGLQLGNWAKHLAAHTDELIISYLKHIKMVYLGIFHGYESLKHLLDEDTVLQLQYRSLKWSIRDRKFIQRAFKKGIIFRKISSEKIRDDLMKNVLSIPGVVPSIATFHANMKYITIGAKILEKYIEIKPTNQRLQRRHSITRSKSSLYDNLKTHWTSDRKSLQLSQEKFVQIRDTPNASKLCFLQLLMAALRYFPHLSSESPLLDKGGRWVGITPDENFQALLCTTAWNLGYDNEKIRRQADREPLSLRYKSVPRLEIWRGGKPPFQVFELLADASFLPQLYSASLQDVDFPSPLQIQGDMLSAFFGSFENLPALIFESVNMNQLNVPFSSIEENYEDDENMDDVGDSGAEEYSNDIELRDAEGSIADPKAIRLNKRKKRREAASNKPKGLPKSTPKSNNRQMSRIVNNPIRQSLFEELANTHPIPARHSTVTIDMDIQQSESLPDNLYEMQQPEEEQQQQATRTYSNSLNAGSSFDADIILANPTPSRDSMLPQPEPLVPPTLASSTTLNSISEEQQRTFEEDTRLSRDTRRQHAQNTLVVKDIISGKKRDDEAELKAAVAQRKAIDEDAAQKIEAVFQRKVDGREDVNLTKELGLIEQNRHRAKGQVEKARQDGASLRIATAMRKITKLLPEEEVAQIGKAFKEDEVARHKIVSKEEVDAKEKFKEKRQAAIKAMADMEAARQEALRMQPQAHSRADGTEIVEAFPSPSDEGPRTPPDLPDGMSEEVREGIDSIR